jgi:enoyl-CoA hydratase/carnithine racemase
MSSERITVDLQNGVADVKMVRADKLNALDVAMFDALVETSAALAADPEVRAVVLSGEGRAFCAGLDFGSFQAMASGPGSPRGGGGGGAVGPISALTEGRVTHHGQQSVYGWTEMAVPVIAAVHGAAFGGGIQLALGADIRIVGPDVQMAVLEIRWGLVPDMTGTQRLIELVGLDVAKELTFTGRVVGADEAVRIGLATRVAEDPRAAALELAAEIAGKSPDAIRGAKRLLNAAGRVSEAEGFARERAEIGALIGSPNQVEAVMAYFEKRPPNFGSSSLPVATPT